jgi:hypothetical protein
VITERCNVSSWYRGAIVIIRGWGCGFGNREFVAYRYFITRQRLWENYNFHRYFITSNVYGEVKIDICVSRPKSASFSSESEFSDRGAIET